MFVWMMQLHSEPFYCKPGRPTACLEIKKIIFNVTCVLCVIAHKDTHPHLLYNMKETGISQWLQVSSAAPSLISVILMLHMMPACMKTHRLCGELRSSWPLWQDTDTVFLLTVSDPWDSDMNLTCFTLARVTLIRVLDILYFPFQEFLIMDWRDVGMAVASPIILFLFFWVLWPFQKCRDKKIQKQGIESQLTRPRELAATMLRALSWTHADTFPLFPTFPLHQPV